MINLSMSFTVKSMMFATCKIPKKKKLSQYILFFIVQQQRYSSMHYQNK